MEETVAAVVIEEANLWLRAALCAGAVALFFFIVGMVLLRRVLPRLLKRLENTNHGIGCTLLRGFKDPLSFYFKVAGGLCTLLVFLHFMPAASLPAGLLNALGWLPGVLYTILRIVTVAALAWGFVASSDITAFVLKNAKSRLDLHMSKSVTRFLSAIFNVVIILVACVIILSELNYDINGLIAGLGLGGLTIALAAQKSAANFFGGLVIVLEKPFEIGDWISTPDVEGSVEDINLRSTRVRTSSGAVTIVPNATLSDAALTNWTGTMQRRRASLTLQLEYSTAPEKVQRFADAVRTMLETDPEILPDGLLVRFSDVQDAALGILVVFNTAKPGYADHMRIKERVNYSILALAKKEGVSFAFPTRTIHIQDQRPE